MTRTLRNMDTEGPSQTSTDKRFYLSLFSYAVIFRFLNPFLLSSDLGASFSELVEPVAPCVSAGVSTSASADLAFNNLSFNDFYKLWGHTMTVIPG